MSFLSLITLICAGLILLIGFQVLLINRKRRGNWMFFLFALLLSWINICWYEMSKTTMLDTALEYRKMHSIWYFCYPLIVYCLYYLAGFHQKVISKNQKYIASAVIILPSFFFIYIESFTNLGHGQLILMSNGQWGLQIDNSNWIDLSRSLWFLIILSFSVYFSYIAFKEETGRRLKRMKAILLGLISISFSIIFIQNFLLPFTGFILPVNESVISLLFVMIFGWAISNFKRIELGGPATIESILESMTNLLIVTDKDFHIKNINPAAEHFFKIKLEDLINQPICKLLGEQLSEKCMERLQFYSGRMSEELELDTPQGPAYMHITMSAVYNAADQIDGYTFIGTDLTSSRKAELQLREYTKQLDKSNEVLENFAYIASHDLKEPLRMVSGFATLLERKLAPDLNKQHAEYFSYITQGVRRMYAIIESVLDVSRLDYEDIKPERVDVRDLIESLSPRLTTKKNQIQIHCEPCPPIFADRKNLEILFYNLIENGIKYNSSEKIHIEVECNRVGDFNEFSIQDNGIGIDPDFHDQVFKMFKRLHTRAKYEGTGMGLAICKRIVEGLGGKIWVESTKEIGTTFKFILPVHQEKVQTVTKNPPIPLTQAS